MTQPTLSNLTGNEIETMGNLTHNEVKALANWTFNYDNAEDEKRDHATCVGTEELKEILGWNAKQVGGLISSLLKKGVIAEHEKAEVDPLGRRIEDACYLSDTGINLAFALKCFAQ